LRPYSVLLDSSHQDENSPNRETTQAQGYLALIGGNEDKRDAKKVPKRDVQPDGVTVEVHDDYTVSHC
jgi:hypothetical protein